MSWGHAHFTYLMLKWMLWGTQIGFERRTRDKTGLVLGWPNRTHLPESFLVWGLKASPSSKARSRPMGWLVTPHPPSYGSLGKPNSDQDTCLAKNKQHSVGSVCLRGRTKDCMMAYEAYKLRLHTSLTTSNFSPQLTLPQPAGPRVFKNQLCHGGPAGTYLKLKAPTWTSTLPSTFHPAYPALVSSHDTYLLICSIFVMFLVNLSTSVVVNHWATYKTP